MSRSAHSARKGVQRERPGQRPLSLPRQSPLGSRAPCSATPAASGHWRKPGDWCKQPIHAHCDGGYRSDGPHGRLAHLQQRRDRHLGRAADRGTFRSWRSLRLVQQARNHNGTSGVYPTAPLFGRFIELADGRLKVLSGKATSAVLGAEYVYCYRATGHIGYGSEQYARSEIPIPIPSAAVRQAGPAAFDILQHAAKRLDQLISNLCEVTDMTDELAEAEKKTGSLTADTRQHIEARAYRALQPIINAAMSQSGQVNTELVGYLKQSPPLAYWLKRWQAQG